MPNKIDEKVKQKIIEAAKAKTPYREIADKYGVATATVSVLARKAGVRARAVRGSGAKPENGAKKARRAPSASFMSAQPVGAVSSIVTSQAAYDYAEWLVRGVNAGFIAIQ